MKHDEEIAVDEAFLKALEPGVERALLRVLSWHVGKESAITKPNILIGIKQHGFTVHERAFRALVNDLRKRGHLICSGSDGYWLAGSREEMEEFLEREVHSRAMDLLEQEKVLRSAMYARWGEAVQGRFL